MLKIFTSYSKIPENWTYISLVHSLFEIGPMYSEVLREPLIEELLYTIEGTTVVNPQTLKTKYDEFINWNQLGTGLKCAICQYYLCNNFNDLDIEYCIDLNRAGPNVIDFMLKHEKYFDKIPMHLTYPGLYNKEYSTDDYPIMLNGVITEVYKADIYMLEKFRGHGSAWTVYSEYEPKLKEVDTLRLIPDMFKGVTSLWV